MLVGAFLTFFLISSCSLFYVFTVHDLAIGQVLWLQNGNWVRQDGGDGQEYRYLVMPEDRRDER
jgi:hypothetical protein